MSKQAEAAAEKIFQRAFGASGDAIGLQEMFAAIIDREYQERELAVAELVREAKQCASWMSGEGWFGMVNSLAEAIAALESTYD